MFFNIDLHMKGNAEINAWRFEHQEDNRGSLWKGVMRNGLEVGVKGNLNHSYMFWIFLQKECTPVLPILFKINKNILNDFLHKNHILDFPGGLVVENLPADAGNMSSNPGPGRFHLPRST